MTRSELREHVFKMLFQIEFNDEAEMPEHLQYYFESIGNASTKNKNDIQKKYEGVISGVTGWGLYVELPNTVEGLVHVASLQGDYFEYNENAYEMVGQRTGKTYRLGQTVRVQVVKADRTTRTVDFELAEAPFVESEFGDHLPGTSELPFSDDRRGIPGLLCEVGEGVLVVVHVSEVDIVSVVVDPGHELHARRGAEGHGVHVFESDGLPGE